LVLFVRIGTFQWVASEKIKKIDSRLKLCAKRLKRDPALVSRLHASLCRGPFGEGRTFFRQTRQDSMSFRFSQDMD
jgi:hypothetical protein